MHPLFFYWPCLMWSAMLAPAPRRIVWKAEGNVIHVEWTKRHHKETDR